MKTRTPWLKMITYEETPWSKRSENHNMKRTERMLYHLTRASTIIQDLGLVKFYPVVVSFERSWLHQLNKDCTRDILFGLVS